MASKPVRSGLNSGTVFSTVIVFLALIGFTETGAVLVAKMLGSAPAANEAPAVGYLVIFLGLLGLWNGVRAANPFTDQPGLKDVGIASLTAGLLTGLVDGILALIFGVLLANEVDPRASLAAVSPESMQLYLFSQSGGVALLYHVVLMAVSGLLGGLLAALLHKIDLKQRFRTGLANLNGAADNSSLIAKIRRSPLTIYIIYAIVAAVLFVLPRQWGSYWNYIIGTVGIYVILGLGLNIIVGLAGQLVLGYVAFFAIGAYTVALLTAVEPHHLQWNFWLVLVIAVILSAFTGVLLGLPILRLRGDYLAIVTLGFGEIIRILLRSDLLTSFTAGPKGVRDIGMPTLFGQPFDSDVEFMYLIIVAVLLIIFITNRLQNSRTGRAWVAIREDEVAAQATGINTFQSKLLALAIGAAFAGLGGVLFASRNQFTGPEDHVMMVSINVLALVIVGGMGSIPGIILGAFALKGLPEILRELDIYRLMFFGALLVAMMIIRPEGLWPATRPSLEQKSLGSSPKEKPAAKAEVESV